jgi:hypothetical protein
MGVKGMGIAPNAGMYNHVRNESDAFIPLDHDYHNSAWDASNANLMDLPPSPAAFQQYRDDAGSRASGTGMSMEYDPYASYPKTHG